MSTLDALLKETALKFPHRTCIRFEKRAFSYSEIERLVSLRAGGLNSSGINRGERVAIIMHNSPEYIISYFSILRAGGTVVPVNTYLTSQEMIYILKDSGAGMLIYSDQFTHHIDKIKKEIRGIKTLKPDEIPHLEPKSSSAHNDDIAVFLYTSGTTGFPKGAMLTHKNLISNVRSCNQVIQINNKDKILLFLPLFHSFTFTVCVLLPIYVGATIVLLESVRPFSKIIKSILKERITYLVAVPTIYNILSKKKIPTIIRLFLRFLLNLRACISGASPLPESTLQEFERRFRVPLLEGYGLTEASPVVSVNPLNGKRKPLSVGPPLPGIEVQVVDEKGKILPHGEVGELIVKGDNVMRGYYNRVEDTKKVLKDGWLYTGDMARIDEDGYIYIVDRKKDLIIVDGMNIYPREVEDIIMEHPDVEECAMIGLPDGKGSEIPCMYIRKKKDSFLDESDIRSFLNRRVARYKMPRRIIFVEDFPRTSTGKIKKTDLKKIHSAIIV